MENAKNPALDLARKILEVTGARSKRRYRTAGAKNKPVGNRKCNEMRMFVLEHLSG